MNEKPQTLRLDDFLPYRLSFTSNLVSGAIARAYQSEFGLKIPEWRLIALVAEGAMTQQAICERSGMDKVTVSRAAATLTDRALIRRVPKEEDRRSHDLLLTDQGQQLYERIAPLALEHERHICADLSAKEQELLTTLLLRIADRARTVDRDRG